MVGGLCSEELLGSVPLIDMLLMSGHDWSQTVDIERHAIWGQEDYIDPVVLSSRTIGS
jgi:hypothetical protein